jgi:hypothetical protein
MSTFSTLSDARFPDEPSFPNVSIRKTLRSGGLPHLLKTGETGGAIMAW